MSNGIYDIDEVIKEIRYYVDLDGPTSQTECISTLCHLARYPDYLSEEMQKMLVRELRHHQANYKIYTVVRTETEPVTRNETTTWLEWL